MFGLDLLLSVLEDLVSVEIKEQGSLLQRAVRHVEGRLLIKDLCLYLGWYSLELLDSGTEGIQILCILLSWHLVTIFNQYFVCHTLWGQCVQLPSRWIGQTRLCLRGRTSVIISGIGRCVIISADVVLFLVPGKFLLQAFYLCLKVSNLLYLPVAACF